MSRSVANGKLVKGTDHNNQAKYDMHVVGRDAPICVSTIMHVAL